MNWIMFTIACVLFAWAVHVTSTRMYYSIRYLGDSIGGVSNPFLSLTQTLRECAEELSGRKYLDE